MNNLPSSINVFTENSGSHLQGIAIDKKREYIYCSFTTCLIKMDLSGNIIGLVKGIVGHLGCIAYNYDDGKVYGSLEFKNDSIGKGILSKTGYNQKVEDGFYIVSFDVDKINRLDMDAEKDGIMQAVFLNEVYNDYSADGHNLGCSGIDGVTFAPDISLNSDKMCIYVAYGVYGDITREDNDYQVILKYDILELNKYAKPLNQLDMHRCGPQKPDSKYFVYTGNTTYGIQNLEYDADLNAMIAAVYPGKKERFPNYPMFFIDCSKKPSTEILKGINKEGVVIALTDFESGICSGDICGSTFAHGSTGIASLGDGYFYIAEHYKNEKGYGGIINMYKFNREKLTFELVN